MRIFTLTFLSFLAFSCSNYNENNTTDQNETTKTELKTEQTTPNMNTDNFYKLTYNTPAGDQKTMKDYEGEVVLIVNTATKCGLTPQFEGLEELHATYAKKGLKVLGFPGNQFGGQEPLSNEEMIETCKVNHGVTFELAQKIEVNGEKSHPIYQFLKTQQPIEGDNEIRWNFEKFIVGKDGKVLKRFSPQTTPIELITEIENLL